MKPHHNLECWKRGISLCKKLYLATEKFPVEEKFGLVSQIRRAGTSVPVNIAEGAARQSSKEFVRFLYIALGSASELDTLLILAHELGMMNKSVQAELFEELDTVTRLITGLKNSLNKEK